MKVSDDQKRQTEAASEASFQDTEITWMDNKEQEVQGQPGRMSPRVEDDSTVRGTCSRLEHLLPPP